MGYLQLFYKVMCPKKYIQTYVSIWFFNKRFPLVLPANDVKNYSFKKETFLEALNKTK